LQRQRSTLDAEYSTFRTKLFLAYWRSNPALESTQVKLARTSAERAPRWFALIGHHSVRALTKRPFYSADFCEPFKCEPSGFADPRPQHDLITKGRGSL
jgi:hypothetical protein